MPPGPWTLPIIGSLHHLVGALPHVSLHALARKHGLDVLLLRLGALSTLVVSSPRAAEEVLCTKDHILASRPPSVVPDIIMYGSSDIAFAPYGDKLRQIRKICTVELFSARRVQSFRPVREEAAGRLLQAVAAAAASSRCIKRSGVGAEGRRRAKVWRRELRSACALAVSVAGLCGGPWCSSGGRSVAAGMWLAPL